MLGSRVRAPQESLRFKSFSNVSIFDNTENILQYVNRLALKYNSLMFADVCEIVNFRKIFNGVVDEHTDIIGRGHEFESHLKVK